MTNRTHARMVVPVLLAVVLALAAPGRAEPRTIELTLRDGALPREQRVIRVRQGDDVTLRWATDRPLTLHLHGYDLERRVAPEKTAEMRFRARAAGRFPITLHGKAGAKGSTGGGHGHGHEETIAYLEVHPR